MKTYLDCYPCLIRHALEVARIAHQDEVLQAQVVIEVMEFLKGIDPTTPPPGLAQIIHRRLREITGIRDPYADIKAKQNTGLLHMEPMLVDHVAKSPDPLRQALQLAGACNAVDMGPTRNWKRVEELFDQLIKPSVGEFDFDAFKKRLSVSEKLLYVGDNAGEIVGDKILISILRKEMEDIEIFFAVRGGPILNDVTLEDAKTVGIEKWAHVITTGSDCPGVILEDCSSKFKEAFYESDMVLAKGQGNYESLGEEKRDIFFLLKVKCPIISRDLGSEVGKTILHEKGII